MTENVVSLIDSEPPNRYRFDYIGMHRYYITMPVAGSKSVFSSREIVVATLNVLRDTAMASHFDVYAYCFLPDRLVLIVRGKHETSNMKAFVAEFRRQAALQLEPGLGHPLWRKKYLERVLRKTEDSRAVADALFQMPVKAGLAKTPSAYPYQGSFVIIPQEQRSKKRPR